MLFTNAVGLTVFCKYDTLNYIFVNLYLPSLDACLQAELNPFMQNIVTTRTELLR